MLVVVVLTTLGCGGTMALDDAGVALVDAGADAARADGGRDASGLSDARDVGVDPPPDGGVDAPFDAGVDASADTGPDTEPLDGGPCAATIDDLAARLAEASCAQAGRCDLVRQLGPGLVDCVATRMFQIANGPYFSRYREAIARGTLMLDGCALDVCVAAVAAEPCYDREALIPLGSDPACARL